MSSNNMLTIQDRDNLLHYFYQNKLWYIFINGQKWFDDKIYDIHWDWEQSGTPSKVDPNHVYISMTCWEIHHGYVEEVV